jgi:hydroxymethylglutaryl-CoA lyase
MAKIKIVEVGPRDGLQNEAVTLSPLVRAEFVRRLADAGLRHIEAGAFVSPAWVPQMQGSDLVWNKIKRSAVLKRSASFLVPNVRGMEKAVELGIKEVAIFGAVSESFSKANINRSRMQSVKEFAEVTALARRRRIKVRGYLSTVFGCPFEGKVAVSQVVKMTKAFLDLGIYELSLGDTIGVATPGDVKRVLKAVSSLTNTNKIAMHFHDTRGTALANVLQSLEMGITTFDSSAGGLGGCPYAPGASGNLATDDLVYMLQGMGLKTGIDLQKLINVSHWISKKISRGLSSRVALAGLPKPKRS